jgi:hypothetical protein
MQGNSRAGLPQLGRRASLVKVQVSGEKYRALIIPNAPKNSHFEKKLRILTWAY